MKRIAILALIAGALTMSACAEQGTPQDNGKYAPGTAQACKVYQEVYGKECSEMDERHASETLAAEKQQEEHAFLCAPPAKCASDE